MSSDKDSDNDSGNEDETLNPYLFKSALDVGSYFIDVEPDNEVVF